MKDRRQGREFVTLAFSNFLRQHDLVQVQWVILSFNISKHPSETFQDLKQIGLFVQAPKKYSKKDLPLRFKGGLVIVGGGEVDLDLLSGLHQGGMAVIGADGGARHCATVGIVPVAIIGDMDSLDNSKDWVQKTSVIELAEQESTDFEKCLYSSEAPITIALGMSGKRLDHTLAALDALVRYSADRVLAIVSETDLILAARGRFEFEVDPGARVSVHPVAPIKFVNSKGLEFALEGVELAPGTRTGTSNRAVLDRFEIVPARGEKSPYLMIVEKKYLAKWMDRVRP